MIKFVEQLIVDEIYDLLEIACQIFSVHKLDYIIGSGTLLGAIRHGGLIPWDDDADIFVLEKNIEEFLSLRPIFLKNEIRVIPWWYGWRLCFSSKASINTAENYPFIDVFPLITNCKDTYAFKSNKARTMWPNEFIYKSSWQNRSSRQFGHLTLSSIDDSSAFNYLTRAYGDDWNEKVYLVWDHINDCPVARTKYELPTKECAIHSRFFDKYYE